MIYNNSFIDSVFLMPENICDYLNELTKVELQTAVLVFSNRNISLEEISKALKIDILSVNKAIEVLKSKSIIQDTASSDGSCMRNDVPSYSSLEIAVAVKSNKDYRHLLDFTGRRIEKVLTPAENALLFSLVDTDGMPVEFVIGVVEYCTRNDKKSVRYIANTARSIFGEGIHTYNELEEYLINKTKRDTSFEKVKRIIGAESRALTTAEKNHITEWTEVYGVGYDLIEYAYEKTINSISKPSVSYMSKIISGWVSNGIKTKEQAINFANRITPQENDALNLEAFIERPKFNED